MKSDLGGKANEEMDAPTRVGVIGCGAVAQMFYSPALKELERRGLASVASLADPMEDSRVAMAAAFPAARTFANATEALAAAGELAIIASPPALHADHARAAFSAGYHVLCEKPMAASAMECDEMIGAAAAAGRLLAVGHYKRFFPSHAAIKQLIEREIFGPLISIDIWEGGKFAWPAASDTFFRKETTPGGVLLDIGVHVLDLLLWWQGEPEDFAYEDDVLDGLEANALMTARFASGAAATVRLSRDWPTLNTYVFRFERATVHLRVNQANKLELTLDGLPMTLAAELREPLRSQYPTPGAPLATNPQAFVYQLIDVMGAIREGRPPRVPGSEGVRAIRWIQQCYENRRPLEAAAFAMQPEEVSCA